jgi:alpha-tubulin suppressor-like RCC1 family protein
MRPSPHASESTRRTAVRAATPLGAAIVGCVLVGSAACIEPRAYPCESSSQCVRDGVQGRCEEVGWCSYPDDACDGGPRLDPLAPDGNGGECIAVGTSTDGGGSTLTEGGSSTTEGPTYTCETRPCTTTGLVVGDAHGCVRDGLDTLWCWGDNTLGQLGRGVTSPAERCAGATVDLGAIVQASASRHMCARDATSRVFCWGNNERGQVDWHAGAEAIVRAPVEIFDLGIVPETLDVGPSLSCAAQGATVRCWGDVGAAETTVETSGPITVLAAGSQHACAVLDDGAVECVGIDTAGQLGDGNPASRAVLEQSRPYEGGVSFVDAGYFHGCALVTTGLGPEVQCWGANDAGQTGAPLDLSIVAAPIKVPNLIAGPYQSLALGARHSCVLAQDGRVQCWGDNGDGQVGPDAPDGFGAHTVVLEGATPLLAIEIAAGEAHTCARTEDATVVCWGSNSLLQLGAASSEVTQTYHWLEIGC